MEKEEEEGNIQNPAPELQQAPPQSKRDMFLERLKGKYPEDNFDDDEALYGRIGEDYDAYEQSIEENRTAAEGLTGLLAADPRAASFLMEWKKGENPILLLMREFGDEFREALDDSQIADKLVEARNEFIARRTRNEELEQQSKANLVEMLENLDKAAAEGGYSEEQADEAFAAFDQITNDAIICKVSMDTWRMIFRALNYDKDVAAAAHEGEVRGRNAKIDGDKRKKTVPEGIPPVLGGASEGKQPPEKDMGVLGRFDGRSVWDGAKRRK